MEGGQAMNHVPKQQWLGCAVAAAAMLAHRSYEDVAGHWAELDEARPLSRVVVGAAHEHPPLAPRMSDKRDTQTPDA
jgi:hypothetical protein